MCCALAYCVPLWCGVVRVWLRGMPPEQSTKEGRGIRAAACVHGGIRRRHWREPPTPIERASAAWLRYPLWLLLLPGMVPRPPVYAVGGRRQRRRLGLSLPDSASTSIAWRLACACVLLCAAGRTPCTIPVHHACMHACTPPGLRCAPSTRLMQQAGAVVVCEGWMAVFTRPTRGAVLNAPDNTWTQKAMCLRMPQSVLLQLREFLLADCRRLTPRSVSQDSALHATHTTWIVMRARTHTRLGVATLAAPLPLSTPC